MKQKLGKNDLGYLTTCSAIRSVGHVDITFGLQQRVKLHPITDVAGFLSAFLTTEWQPMAPTDSSRWGSARCTIHIRTVARAPEQYFNTSRDTMHSCIEFAFCRVTSNYDKGQHN